MAGNSGCQTHKDASLKSQNIMSPPLFLRAFVSGFSPSDKQKLSSSTDAERRAFVGGAGERDEKETQLTSSASSTSATATADSSANGAKCNRLVANEAQAALLSSTAMNALKISLALSKDEMDEPSEDIVNASASPRACATTPQEGESLLIQRFSRFVGAAKRRELVARLQRSCSGPGKSPKRESTSEASETDARLQKGGNFVTCNTAAADLPIARLATALAASSLRLAAAAEEGLESSPPHSRSSWCLGLRAPPPAKVNTASSLDTFEPVTRTTNPQRRCKKPSACQAALHLGAAVAKGPGICSCTASSKSSPNGAMQHVSPEDPPGYYFQQHPRKAPLTRMKAAPVSTSPVSTLGHKVASLSRRNVHRCSEGGPSQAAHDTSSGSCRSCRQRQEERASFLWATLSSPNLGVVTPSSPVLRNEHLQGASRLPLMNAPSPLSQMNQAQVRKQDCSATVTSLPEEEQFSLLLQHSMLLLKREAARCFASSQASTKQKLWREWQQERMLRLQEQQEHRVALANAAAELELVRASRDCNRSRTERLLGISCRRKTAHDDSGLLVCAWRAWQQHRILLRRRKQVERVSQQRRLLLLLLRTFLPWRAAAFRCRAERQQRRSQRLMQQEMQRLEQMHVERKTRQQQQLLQLRQQLAGVTWLRQCLEQSLVGVVADGTGGNVTRGEARRRSFAEAGGSITAPRGVLLKAKQKQKQRDLKDQQCLPIRQKSPLTLFGMNANPKGREASGRLLKQHQHLERDQSVHRPRQAWTIQAPTKGPSGSDCESARSQLGAKNQRVRFVDAKSTLQGNTQQLLVLANLLALSNTLRTMDGDQSLPVGVPKRQENHLRILHSAFATASTLADSSSKDSAPGVAGHPAIQAKGASGTLQPLQQGAESLGENIVQEGSVGLFGGRPFCVDGQLPKSRRWAAATQLDYAS
ncbi:hypothetical protein Emag_000533 [Eimeria magna]